MKIKKMVSALCLAAGLVLSVPSFTALPGHSGTVMTVQAADGWGQDANGIYYLQGSQRVIGLQNIGGATYYFNANGYRFTGTIKLDKYTYYFNPKDGKLVTGYAGLAKNDSDPNTYYYFLPSKKGRVAVNQWVKHNGKYYYADQSGQIRLGTIKVNGKLYHVTAKGRMTAYGKSSYDGNYYNASKTGVLLTGLRKIKGKTYYFNPQNGARQTGQVTIGKTTYYFNEKTGAAGSGWSKVDGKYYYYLKNGKKALGWQTIDKKKYYFNAKNGGARQTSSWLRIGKYTYYFDEKGLVKTDFFKVDGKTYYASSTGIRKTGWVTVNGKKYYLTPGTGVMKTGWFTNNKKTYYLSPSAKSKSYGAAVTGWLRQKNATYFFDSDGAMHKGWLQETNAKYYFDKSTGKMVTGKKTIDGKSYDFGENGKITVALTGPWSVKVQRGNSSNGNECFVVVYRGDTAVKAFVCSTARDGVSTPTGTFSIWDKLYWHELNGPSWGQYCSHITSSILFHSVPNLKYRDPYSLETWEYNKLGKPASAGCIRLSVKHAKWLFENVPVGTKVTVSNHVTKPTNISIETVPRQSSSNLWDPTDTFVNPYSVRKKQ